jgi:hypothetical protein
MFSSASVDYDRGQTTLRFHQIIKMASDLKIDFDILIEDFVKMKDRRLK